MTRTTGGRQDSGTATSKERQIDSNDLESFRCAHVFFIFCRSSLPFVCQQIDAWAGVKNRVNPDEEAIKSGNTDHFDSDRTIALGGFGKHIPGALPEFSSFVARLAC